ncbi:MAG: proline--tRNA ligase [Rickettsiales bacterium]|jgi:prolyl-tRNA synthetase|nr:proline--tRNA ligase [Rickettsiales bacterium]
MAKTAITPTREENFSEWYQNLITAADLAENSPVRGCMTVKPYGWAIWELMRDEMDKRIKAAGVSNAQFPLLIPIEYFNREARHVEGFAKECAVVTNYRLKMIDGTLQPDPDSKLTEPYIIRPTSETIIGEAMSRWVQSYRDLPMKLNQWANVMRWEMRPRLFLRTSEFFWQEGHNVFATHAEAAADADKMHKVYAEYARNVLAIESVLGEKTPEERFAGADHTFTMEHIMQDGKALQAGTSHDLGQHFSKSFDIKYLGADGELHHAWTTSWGTSTRMMGSVFMSHSDDDGLVLPPAIAPYQVVIIPILPEQNEYARDIASRVSRLALRVIVDDTDARSADKMWKWIKRGVPLRIEVGANEQAAGTITITRRDLGKASKQTVAVADAARVVGELLTQIQSDMLAANIARNKTMIHDVKNLAELDAALRADTRGFFRLKYELTMAPEFERLVDTHKISRRCLDESDPTFVYVAKSY